MVSTLKRPALRYHGGKWMLAPWIISHFPEHRIYVEPFAGAASVLLRKPRTYAEVYNDLSGNVVNVFEVLRDSRSAVELERLIRLTPFARAEFEACVFANITEESDPIERARMMILRSFAGFGGVATHGHDSTGFRANCNRAGTTPAHDWMNYPDSIKGLTERLQGVVIESRPAADVIKVHDTPETLHYVDPPYVQSTRNLKSNAHVYEHEMTEADHTELAELLNTVQGMVVLSGYRCDLYDELFEGWERRDVEANSNLHNARTESIWLNEAASTRTPQSRLF